MRADVLNRVFQPAFEGEGLLALERVAPEIEKLAAKLFQKEAVNVTQFPIRLSAADLSIANNENSRLFQGHIGGLMTGAARSPSTAFPNFEHLETARAVNALRVDLDELGYNGKVVGLEREHVPIFQMLDGRPNVVVRSAISGTEYTQIFRQYKDAVIRIGSGEPAKAGSGYMINHQLALTADHVIFDKATRQLSPNLQARFADGTRKLIDVVARAPNNDLALVRIIGAGNQYPLLRLGTLDGLTEGERLYTIGHPFRSNEPVLTRGEFQNWGRNTQQTATLTTTIPGWRGFSGGPVLKLNGEVAGTMVRKGDGLSSAVASEHASALVKALNHEIPQRGMLMVDTRAYYDFSGTRERAVVKIIRTEHVG